MKRRLIFGLVLAATAVASVLAAGRPARRDAEEWERVKADVRAWTADNDAFTARLMKGEPRDEKYADELVERMRVLNLRYAAVRKW